jgi:hypothetical protein
MRSPERSGKEDTMASGQKHRASVARADRIRRRLDAQPELELDAEELQALADHGIDPAEVRRIALERRKEEVSIHDRDTARDELEALVLEHSQDDVDT